MSSIIIFHQLLFLLGLFIQCTFTKLEIDQTIFLHPKNQFSILRCPLDDVTSLDIQWFDVNQQRFDNNRGRFYRIEGQENTSKQLICSSRFNENHQVKFNLRIYDRPLPIEHVSIINITNTSLTIQWKDDPSNRYANITAYELILKYDHFIQSRILVNQTIFMYTFSSLQPSTFYSIDISVIDQWKRSSRSQTIVNQTYPLQFQKKIFFNQIIDSSTLDQSINCYDLQSKFLFVEFNSSTFQMLNHIYQLTIFNKNHQIIIKQILYTSIIYPLNNEQQTWKYRIELRVSTSQSEYLGKINKDCEEFYPKYSPIICSMKLIQRNQYHLMIHQHHQMIESIDSKMIFYRINQSFVRIWNLSEIHHHIIDRMDGNYSITMENELFDERFNLSIPCLIHPASINYPQRRISPRILIGLFVVFVVLLTSIWLIVHRKFESIPLDAFPSYVSSMHQENNIPFIRLFRTIDRFSDVNMSSHMSSIDDYEEINGYMISQQLTFDSMGKFWRMIWGKDVNVIVMMTNSNNRGNNSSSIVYSEEESTREIHGDFEVVLKKINSRAYYIERCFIVRYNNHSKVFENDDQRLVQQFHFTHWPDDHVPCYPLSVLSFIRAIVSCHSEIGGPIFVHCSSGISYTGVYIVIDTMLKSIDRKQSLNIPLFLRNIRQQRCDLVRTEEEFIFIYDVLREAVELEDFNGNSNNIEEQFQLIQRRSEQNSIEISDLTYLHGYHRMNEFLLIEHPTVNTRIDFWRMIWSTQIDIIVALYADENIISGLFDYWPTANQIIDCGDIHISLIDERFQCEYIYRDCLIQSVEESQCQLQVRIISTTYWPETCSPIETSFDLITTIENLHTSKPIVVHDLVGGHRAATFCALFTMKEQIKHEGKLNVYELAKFYSIKRPGIWRNSDDLLFLYHCARILFQQCCQTNSS